MTPISGLNLDVLREIFIYFGKPDLLNISLVCKEWHAVAQDLIDNTVDLIATARFQNANLQLLKRLQLNTALQNRVTNIEVTEWHLDPLPRIAMAGHKIIHDPWEKDRYFSPTYTDDSLVGDSSRALLDALCNALTSKSLKNFTWKALHPIPKMILDKLEVLPECAVHILSNNRALDTAFWSYAPITNHLQTSQLGAIANNLASLDLLIPPADMALLESLGHAIAASTQLKSLKLYAMGRLWKKPCVPLHLMGGPHKIFRPTLSLEWLRTATQLAGGLLRLHTLTLENFCLCDDADFRLGDFLDTSALQSLAISCFGLCANIDKKLQLRSFQLQCSPRQIPATESFCRNKWAPAAAFQFLMESGMLSNLRIVNDPGILSDSLVRHIGSRLRKLSYYRTSSVSDRGTRSRFFSASSLETWHILRVIGTACPQLRDLILEGPCPDSELFAQFQDLLRVYFSTLDKLTLILPAESYRIAPYGEHAPQRNTLTLSAMPKIWDHLVVSSDSSSRLTELQLVFDARQSWDRDRLASQLASHVVPELSRTLVAKTACQQNQRIPLELQLSSSDIEEASIAVRQGWLGMKPGHWAERLSEATQVATLEKDLILRVGFPSIGLLNCADSR